MRELALSYFHEYFMDSGEKTLISYSRAFSLKQFPIDAWLTAEEELIWLVDELNDSRHLAIMPAAQKRHIRKASPFEIKSTKRLEWSKKGRKLTGGSSSD
jgi:hypothetical protein